MLSTFSARGQTAVLSLLAVLYLAVGSHALHPHVHRHSPDSCKVPSPSAHLSTSEQNHHEHLHHHRCRHEHDQEQAHAQEADYPPCFAEYQLNHRHRCPLCEFLACSWLLLSASNALSFCSAPAEHSDIPYQAVIGSVQPCPFPIRGPPCPIC